MTYCKIGLLVVGFICSETVRTIAEDRCRVPNCAPPAIKYVEGAIFAQRRKGRAMQNQKDLDQAIQSVLEFVGGEPLTGSGFEAELPEPTFDSEERPIEEVL